MVGYHSRLGKGMFKKLKRVVFAPPFPVNDSAFGSMTMM